MHNWLLPEYIEDVLPAQAAQIEHHRRALLDLYHIYGYQYVIPPMLEYMESLTTGAGRDLDLATYKLVDHFSGRLMGVRADMTPQAARIDAHLLNESGVTRLCYAGSVLKTSPDGLAHSREPIQVGAELYGHQGVEGDIEIQRLMIQSLQAIGVTSVKIDLSHVDIFGSLISACQVSDKLEYDLHNALLKKDQTEISGLAQGLDESTKQALLDLTTLYGDATVLTRAKSVLPDTPAINAALNDLSTVQQALSDLGVETSFDLSDLRGYHYHSGMVFTAYANGYKGPVGLGGRYDEVGRAFGRARAATGFSLDLRGLVVAQQATQNKNTNDAIWAPALNGVKVPANASLVETIQRLRHDGNVVIQQLGDEECASLCNQKLTYDGTQWQVVKN